MGNSRSRRNVETRDETSPTSGGLRSKLRATILTAIVCLPGLAKAAEDAYSTIDRYYEELAQVEHLPGVIFGVVKNGRLEYVKSIGTAETMTQRPIDADTRFRIASMTKSFTALAVLALRDAGKLSLDAAVEQYIPEFPKAAAFRVEGRPITVRMLLTNTAGFVTDNPWADRQLAMTPQAFSKFIAAGWTPARAPALAFEYANLGYALLGRIVSNVSGQPYQDYIKKLLLDPLGMSFTTFDVSRIPSDHKALGYRWTDQTWVPEPVLDDGDFASIGGLWTTANDYARYLAFLLSAWPAREQPDAGPVRRATVRELASGQGFPDIRTAKDAAGMPCEFAFVYGYGMQSAKGCSVGPFVQHSGGLPGFGSNVLLMPDTGSALFAFANRSYAPVARANLSAASALRRDGLALSRGVPPSDALQRAVDGVLAVYDAGDVETGVALWAENLLMDESSTTRNAELAALKVSHGRCRLGHINAVHAMAARFEFACERGAIVGSILLAPGVSSKVQELSFSP